LIVFVVSTAGKIGLAKVYKGASLVIIAMMITMVLIIIFPEITPWLPSTMR
jgi:TRAP-type C4-dicarboxylate transport system permease large subunit